MTIPTIGKQWEFRPQHKYFFVQQKSRRVLYPTAVEDRLRAAQGFHWWEGFWRAKVLKSEPFPCCPGLVLGYQLNSPHEDLPPPEKIKNMDPFCKKWVHLKWVAYSKSACHSILISDCPHAFDKSVSFHYFTTRFPLQDLSFFLEKWWHL